MSDFFEELGESREGHREAEDNWPHELAVAMNDAVARITEHSDVTREQARSLILEKIITNNNEGGRQ